MEEMLLLVRKFLFQLARLMAEAQIWEFKSTQNAHTHTRFQTAKLGVRNAEHSKPALVRLLYPEPSLIFCQKSIYHNIKKSFKIDY